MGQRSVRLGDLYCRRSALLIGNGLNLAESGVEWPALLEELRDRVGLGRAVALDAKPYPLAFEEILYRMPGSDVHHNLRELRKEIGVIVTGYGSGALHKQVIASEISDILTTNYDYALEQALDSNFRLHPKPVATREYRYSLRRHRTVDQVTVWHVHGELDNGYTTGRKRYPEESILIGHEHYADYLRALHETLKPKTGRVGLAKVLEADTHLWAGRFFTHDLHILGFGLHFTEIHFWWLLNFRARLLRSGSSIRNRIRYYLPDVEETAKKPTTDVLDALGVTISIMTTSGKDNATRYRAFYRRALEVISAT